jgi:methionyl-tRNA formyltransferase
MPTAVLIGLGPTALAALESLVDGFDVIGIFRNVYPEPAAPDPLQTWSVRGLDTWVPGRQAGDAPEDLVIRHAVESGIPVYADTSPFAIHEMVADSRPDCVVISSYDRILPLGLLALSKFVNIHYAPLPQYRGRGMWAIINDEPFTAITIHEVAEGLDAGNILFQQTVPIRGTDTVADLYERLNELQRQMLGETVMRFLGGYQGIPQRQDGATYGCSSDCDCPEDGEIDWSAPTKKIDCLIRGLAFPFPGARTYFNGERLLIWRAAPAVGAPHYAGRIAGRVVARSRTDGFVDILTGDGTLRLFEVQAEGQERVPAASVIRSVSDTLGMRTIDLLNRIEALERQVRQLTKAPTGGIPP